MVVHSGSPDNVLASIQFKQGKETSQMERPIASRLFAFLTFTAGVVTAYLMYQRGESPLSIAKNTLLNPVGSLASEIQKTAS
jgi:hypothetical protein